MLAQQAREHGKQVRSHFLHLQHPLVITHSSNAFTCSACLAEGRGIRYSCEGCAFHLHAFCANCPATVRSPLHPQHSLKLNRRLCSRCCKPIKEKAFYWCETCEAGFHGTCLDEDLKELPRNISSRHHPQHWLTRWTRICDDCKQPINGISFVCTTCDLDFHPLCYHLANVITVSARETISPETSIYFFVHPEHQLTQSRAGGPACPCEVCGDPVDGDCFRCEPCKFHVHKQCTLVKPVVKDETHPAHMLHCLKTRANPCKVCGKICLLWRYHCTICNVHVHRNCLKLQG